MIALSVIVPVYREGAGLQVLLTALRAQTFHADRFEVILVDNDPDGPAPLPPLPVLPFAAQVVACRIPGSYAARNAGAGVARGQYLVFTDADCRPAPDWLAAMSRALQDHEGQILAGDVQLDAGPDPSDWAIFDTVRGIPQAVFVRRGYGATANLALSRSLFGRLGGFDPQRLSGGDAEFCRRAGRQGGAIRFVAGAVVHHPARDTAQALWLKARRIKGGQVASGPHARRMIWTLRSLAPPVREMAAYAVSPHPWRWRLTACRVRLWLWRVDLAEIWRLLVLRHPPERR